MDINYIGVVFDLKLQLNYSVPQDSISVLSFNVLYTFVKVLLFRADSHKLCLAYFMLIYYTAAIPEYLTSVALNS